MSTVYDWRTDSSLLSTDTYETFLDPATGDFTVSVIVEFPPPQGAAGIMISEPGGEVLHFALGDATGLDDVIVLGIVDIDEDIIPYAPPATLIIQYTGGVTSLWWSNDGEVTWNEWPDAPQIPQPDEAGAFVYTATPGTTETGVVAQPRLFPGELLLDGNPSPPEEQFATIGFAPSVPPPPVTVSSEAVVHALCGAQFGDLELDVGKSVGWTQRFADDVFISDQGGGTQRYWVINWSASFPEAYWAFSTVNYFVNPVNYRKEQWANAQATKGLTFDDNDWVVFVDAHEGLSSDTRSLPDDYLISPYQSYIYREIARANEDDLDRIVLPFFVWVSEVGPQNVSYDHPYFAQFGAKATQAASVPYYLPYQGLTRIIRVATLRDPEFDWSLIDTPVAIPDPAVKLQLISYGYGHWNIKDIVPPATTVAELSAENDLGWQQRCMMSRVLPITGLPYGDYNDPVGTWQDPEDDVDGIRGPWCLDLKPTTGAECPDPPGAPPAETEMLLTPMYHTIVRINLRDGAWYYNDALGNVPMYWNEDESRWEAFIDADQWHNTPNWVTQ